MCTDHDQSCLEFLDDNETKTATIRLKVNKWTVTKTKTTDEKKNFQTHNIKKMSFYYHYLIKENSQAGVPPFVKNSENK